VVKADVVRNSFVRIMKSLGHPEATCPKSWRHSFATLLQDANVAPLIRQQVLGHKPTNSNGLGMTANYTHTHRGPVGIGGLADRQHGVRLTPCEVPPHHLCDSNPGPASPIWRPRSGSNSAAP